MADETQAADNTAAVDEDLKLAGIAEPTEVAAEPVATVEEDPEPMPAEIEGKIAKETPFATAQRVTVWLSETRYLISTLEHEVDGDAGEIIAYLKARL